MATSELRKDWSCCTDPWLQTSQGVVFRPFDPKPEDINIEDIAHSLAMLCRYNGHCTSFYSVAEHSVTISKKVPPQDAMWGLLHDAAEAYIGDIPKPVKDNMPGWADLERKILSTVAVKFDLPDEIPLSVKDADSRILVTEARDYMGPHPKDWGIPCAPYPETLKSPMLPATAKQYFLQRYYALIGG